MAQNVDINTYILRFQDHLTNEIHIKMNAITAGYLSAREWTGRTPKLIMAIWVPLYTGRISFLHFGFMIKSTNFAKDSTYDYFMEFLKSIFRINFDQLDKLIKMNFVEPLSNVTHECFILLKS